MFFRYKYVRLLFVKLLELYSFYGLRSVLVLIFVSNFGLADREAITLYTTFVVGGDVISLFGAYFGDKLLTSRLSWLTGVIFSSFGYFYSYLHFDYVGASTGLVFSGIGLGLARANSNVMVNNYIQEEIDPEHRHNHNGIFHVATIIALMLGFVINGLLLNFAEPKLIFLASSVASVISFVAFIILEKSNIIDDLRKSFLGELGKLKILKIAQFIVILLVIFALSKLFYVFKEWSQAIILVALVGSASLLYKLSHKYASREQQSIWSLLVYVPFYLIYLSFEKQLDMGFALFLDRNVDRHIFGFELPVPNVNSVFSITILAFTLFFFRRSIYSYFQHGDILLLGFVSSLLYFSFNYLGCYLTHTYSVAIIFPALSLVALAIADIFIVPRMYSLCRTVPENIRSTASSLMMISHGCGFYVAGLWSKFWEVDKNSLAKGDTLEVYSSGFLTFIMINALTLLCVMCVNYWRFGSLLNRK